MSSDYENKKKNLEQEDREFEIKRTLSISYNSKVHDYQTQFRKVSSSFIGCEHVEVFEICCEATFGYTIANGLRRILLSSITGSGIVSVYIKGANNEFANINGVVENVPEILINLKKIIIQITGEEDIYILSLNKSGGGNVNSSQIKKIDGARIINDVHICTLDKEGEISMCLIVAKGKGYIPSDRHTFDPELSGGFFPVDTFFSPVVHCSYDVQTCTDQEKPYDKIILKIITNGYLAPEEVLNTAVQDLFNKVSPLLSKPFAQEEINNKITKKQDTLLFVSLENLEGLSKRVKNALVKQNILTIEDLINRTQNELMSYPGIGVGGLHTIESFLNENGLELKAVTKKIWERDL